MSSAVIPLLLLALVAAPPDTLRLEDLQAEALRRDPRTVQPALLEEASRLRLENLRAQHRPRLALTGQATYQSATATIPVDLPNVAIPEAPLERFQVQAGATQLLYDGGRTARQAAVERAALAEQQAGVEVGLYALRQAVTEAFFGALLLEAQARALDLGADDLAARLALVQERVRHGAALRAEGAALEAELIRVRQARREAEAGRHAALAVLADLTGRPVTDSDTLALPDLTGAVRETLAADAPESRPEWARFERTRERLAAEAALARVQTRPQASLFGQAGVGRPSPFEPFGDAAEPFGMVGVRVRWDVLDWGQARREAEVRRLQAEAVGADAAAFARQLRRDTQDDLAAIDRLEAALAEDERAVALRGEILRVARQQLDEGVLLAADYADRLSDLLDARLTLDRHRIELARARARLLTTLGRFPEP